MPDQMIPAEAIEVAAMAFINTRSAENFVSPQEYAEAMLEAAAPYMMAGAWDQGYKSAMFDKEYYSHNTNPYMRDTEGEK